MNNLDELLLLAKANPLAPIAVKEFEYYQPTGANIGRSQLEELEKVGIKTYSDGARPLSYSSLKGTIFNVDTYIDYLIQKIKDSSSMSLGRLFEDMLYADFGGEFKREFAKYEVIQLPVPTSTAAKKENAEYLEDLKRSGKVGITSEEYKQAKAMVASALKNPLLKKALESNPTIQEDKIDFDTKTGLWLVSKPDMFFEDETGLHGIDLKTSNSMSSSDFQNRIFGKYSYQYWLQIAIYSLIHQFQTFSFVVTCSVFPYITRSYTFDIDTIEACISKLRQQPLNDFNRALDLGFYEDEGTLDVPTWF